MERLAAYFVQNARQSKQGTVVVSLGVGTSGELADAPIACFLQRMVSTSSHLTAACCLQMPGKDGTPSMSSGFAPTAVDYARASSVLARHEGV